ncbi:hypothetical protein IHN63_00735 [Deinococcus sp. 6YEL10]|uniref:hypothetical protein n=1 Tax=Deinococcus sp. 6YEL10 TaxID=2745870 RepID=UPI001E3109C7|nr:hypothetical protein [Deinococcus sp. 6YEL10]MCD0159823.1 hypothetical protein [Deinococcus sp. 6YEL10]
MTDDTRTPAQQVSAALSELDGLHETAALYAAYRIDRETLTAATWTREECGGCAVLSAVIHGAEFRLMDCEGYGTPLPGDAALTAAPYSGPDAPPADPTHISMTPCDSTTPST